jgi:hypothetical protein
MTRKKYFEEQPTLTQLRFPCKRKGGDLHIHIFPPGRSLEHIRATLKQCNKLGAEPIHEKDN